MDTAVGIDTWTLTGLDRPDDEDFVWRGKANNRTGSVRRIGALLGAWLAWARLEQIGDLQRGVKR